MLNNLLLGQTAEEKLYVEDVFSTWLYTDNGSTNTITNGIDLSGKGGLVWAKPRSAAYQHEIYDTARGNYRLTSDSAGAQANMTGSGYGIGFTSTGFTIGSANTNTTYVSWTFRKSPKFFDCVTWTGNGAASRTLNHSLGVTPGLIIIKQLNGASNWSVWHRSMSYSGFSQYRTGAYLNATDAVTVLDMLSADPTSTSFTTSQNGNTNTHVAYLFAHDTTADGIVQCGSYTGGGATNTSVNLGWEPQYVLIKSASVASQWAIYDNMRGVFVNGSDALLYANLSNAEANTVDYIDFHATGFTTKVNALATNSSGQTYIYLAIRRGPMRVPTDATKVMQVFAKSVATKPETFTTNFPADTVITSLYDTYADNKLFSSRLTGGRSLKADQTNAEGTTEDIDFKSNTNVKSSLWDVGYGFAQWVVALRRSPGFFDVTCYSGTGVARTVSHNLGVAPELIIVKRREAASDWNTYFAPLGPSDTSYVVINDTITPGGYGSRAFWNATSPTATVFSVGGNVNTNLSGSNYVAYLFASCPGVSKVGSYTGNGSSQNIDCGFTNGARFVLIKRTDSTGDWYVWDTARGIVAAGDPHIRLNLTNPQVTGNDSIDPLSTGFTVVQNTTTNINVNAATYIYLAIA